MMEQNEVIKAIHHCIADERFIQRSEGPFCAGCPYKDDPVCVATLKSDIQKLLKAEEPMVITPETMGAMSRRPVWLETKNGRVYNGYVLVYEVQYGMGISGVTDKRLGLADPSGRMHWLKMCDYGVTWHCWTSRPTDEQREGTPWLLVKNSVE